MDNVSWVSNKPKENLKEEERYIIPTEEFIKLKEELVSKCNELSKMVNNVYNIKTTKELYDSVVLVYALEKSLNLIHIKEPLVDKTIKKEEV